MITLYIVHHDREFHHMDKAAKFDCITDAVKVRDELNQEFKGIKSFVIVNEDNTMINPTSNEVSAFVRDYYL